MNRLLKDLDFKVYTTIEKVGNSGERRLIRGYASVGDILDRQNEVITLGALVRAREDLLKNHTIFYEHKHSELPIGKTIAVDIDEKGLLITVELSKGSHADSVWTLIQEGILNSFSIGGRVLEAEEKRDKEGNIFNEITRIELFETSIVGIPANPSAKFEVVSKSFGRAISEQLKKKREVSNMAKEVKKENEKTDENTVETKEQVTKSEEKKETETAEKSEESKEEVFKEKEVEKSEETKEEKETEKSEEADEEKEEDKLEKVHTNNGTDEVNLHWHEAAVDAEGNGETTTIVTKEGYSGDANHVHPIVVGEVQEVDGHPHTLIAPVETNVETETDKSKEKSEEKKEEKSEEVSEETTSLEEKSSEKESEEELEEEKTIDELILEKLGQIIENQEKKKSKKVEETKEEVEAPKEEKSEEVKETVTTKSEDKVETTKSTETTEKSKEKEESKDEKDLEKVEKIEDAPKEEKSEEKETPTRKGEAILAQTPYATEGEEKPKVDEKAIQKYRDLGWCKLIYGK